MADATTTKEFHAPIRTPALEAKPHKAADFKSDVKPDWCPSCGDFGVLAGLQKAVSTLGIQPKDILTVSGIGCSSNLPGFFRTYGVHSLHGRAVAVASGAKLANPDLTVIITGGDGDGYGIGLGHFLHAVRRNLDVTYIVMNNQIYGLTTGQASPTTQMASKTKSTPAGCIEGPLNPLALAIISGATFVARAFSGEPNHMADVMAKAIAHKGFSLVDCFSPCVTYNKVNTYQWFRERAYKLEDKGHDSSDFKAAIDKAFEEPEKIPLGVFYQRTDQKTYEELDGAIAKHGSPVRQPLKLPRQELQALWDGFK
ncbi:MAG: 2-oxoacid:ferredoxin oxidoreductase subunit beta [Elusimicrobia bacterium]|nr:2-oxoacid:ferredoxin oxidoreductase subunit beta [Elusimicrobiota bacterium]